MKLTNPNFKRVRPNSVVSGYAILSHRPSRMQLNRKWLENPRMKARWLLLIINGKERLESQKQKLEDVFENWKGNLEQVDDVCVIGIRI